MREATTMPPGPVVRLIVVVLVVIELECEMPQLRRRFRMIGSTGGPDQARTDEIERNDRRHYDSDREGSDRAAPHRSSRLAHLASVPSSPHVGVSIVIVRLRGRTFEAPDGFQS